MFKLNRDGRNKLLMNNRLKVNQRFLSPSKNSMVCRKCCKTTFKCIKTKKPQWKRRNSHKRNDRCVVSYCTCCATEDGPTTMIMKTVNHKQTSILNVYWFLKQIFSARKVHSINYHFWVNSNEFLFINLLPSQIRSSKEGEMTIKHFPWTTYETRCRECICRQKKSCEISHSQKIFVFFCHQQMPKTLSGLSSFLGWETFEKESARLFAVVSLPKDLLCVSVWIIIFYLNG